MFKELPDLLSATENVWMQSHPTHPLYLNAASLLWSTRLLLCIFFIFSSSFNSFVSSHRCPFLWSLKLCLLLYPLTKYSSCWAIILRLNLCRPGYVLLLGYLEVSARYTVRAPQSPDLWYVIDKFYSLHFLFITNTYTFHKLYFKSFAWLLAFSWSQMRKLRIKRSLSFHCFRCSLIGNVETWNSVFISKRSPVITFPKTIKHFPCILTTG